MNDALLNQMLADVEKYIHNPLGYAYWAYPWGEPETALEGVYGPKVWQVDVLTRLTMHLSNPATRHDPFKLIRASGHGIGKSALIGIVSDWGLTTCDDCRIVITANTEGQLRTKTSPEVSKWFRMSLLASQMFKIETMSIHAHGDYASSWRLDFIPWSINNTEAFAGLHNKRKRIIIFMDEGSAIDDKIWEVTQGALTDEDTEIIWIVFGNPTRNTGYFRECFRKYARYWDTGHIDASTVEGTNKKQFKEWLEQHGFESDFYKIRVRGEFPNQSAKQFFPTDMVDRSRNLILKKEQFDFAPKIIAVDPSWEGDDVFVIGLRQGLSYRVLAKLEKNTNDVQMANVIAKHEDEQGADAVFIDGGYGTGIVSVGRTMNRNWQLVWFSEKPFRPDCINKRAEMYVSVLEWLHEGGKIPDDDDLFEEMIAIETTPRMDGKYQILSKKEIKEIIGRSCDLIDNLAISFAYPVQPKLQKSNLDHLLGAQRAAKKDYNPLDNA